MKTRCTAVRSTIVLLIAGAAIGAATLSAEETAFDRYIKKPDATYAWRIASNADEPGAKTFVVHLKSQTWRTKEEVDRPVWEHWLVIVKPERPASRTAFLMIGGGRNGGEPPRGADERTRRIAAATGSVVAELRMIPNQPLVFHQDGVPRSEDDLIGYTWDQYIKTGDPTWAARLPMVKSAVRAMDCIQELCAGEAGGKTPIEKFVVAGGSKRGWTTWMTGAMDSRVAAIVPIVIDVVNVDPSMRHHVAAYGFWARAIGDYYRHGMMERWDHPRVKELYRLVDPYFYRDRLTMPKYIVNASGDEFFLPDSSQFYYQDLQGEKLLRYVPNAGHSLKGSDAIESIAAFYKLILAGKPRPRYSWTFEADGSIRVRAEDRPARVLLWQATNPKARDFRLATIGEAYTSRELSAEDGAWTGRIEKPVKGWTAFFIELTYDAGGLPLKVTTAVRVLPDTLPHAGVDLKKAPYEGSEAGSR